MLISGSPVFWLFGLWRRSCCQGNTAVVVVSPCLKLRRWDYERCPLFRGVRLHLCTKVNV
ncbi:unnamed protein product [Ectocarpus sp. CCAP 1310/34]|nr:unnamed protein product [Ectocarpus sp. CCAP 1310/34]